MILAPDLTFQVKIFDSDVLPGNVNQISNMALITDQSTFPYGQNSNVANTTLLRPDLKLTKSNSPGEDVILAPGETIDYTIRLLNDGTGNATNVTVKDLVPDYTTYVAGSCNAGGVTSGTCDLIGNEVIWNFPVINAQQEVLLTFKVTANTGLAVGTYTIANSASVTSTEITTPVNSNTVTNILRVEPQLSIVKSQTSNSTKDSDGIVMPGIQ